jgi:TPP-dependent 2-oxoacid decarboxylase
MTYIEDDTEYEVAELICLKCLNRWIGVYPSELPLKDIKCKCGEVGYVIKTGQTLPDVDVKKFEHDARYQNMVKMWGRKVAIEKYKSFVLGQ